MPPPNLFHSSLEIKSFHIQYTQTLSLTPLVLQGRVQSGSKWQVAWNLRSSCPGNGTYLSSELIKNRAELNESDIRVKKIETKDGQDKSCWKNSSGRSPLTDERIAQQAAI
ncbi:hypothetical protein TNCV_4804651 [Trichonephila clavipes]|nr:hypothetical protein TNCV_4804651 [Trichonephila clavipes]